MIKSKDLPMFVLVVGASAILSFVASNLIFGKAGERSTKIEIVDPITSDFNYENKPYFKPNPDNPAIVPLNPTKDITVNENNNTAPLGQ